MGNVGNTVGIWCNRFYPYYDADKPGLNSDQYLWAGNICRTILCNTVDILFECILLIVLVRMLDYCVRSNDLCFRCPLFNF